MVEAGFEPKQLPSRALPLSTGLYHLSENDCHYHCIRSASSTPGRKAGSDTNQRCLQRQGWWNREGPSSEYTLSEVTAEQTPDCQQEQSAVTCSLLLPSAIHHAPTICPQCKAAPSSIRRAPASKESPSFLFPQLCL